MHTATLADNTASGMFKPLLAARTPEATLTPTLADEEPVSMFTPLLADLTPDLI